jgi:hypothetical protein
VSKDVAQQDAEVFATLTEAVDEWNAQPAGTAGIITIHDDRTYDEPALPEIVVPTGSQLAIVAARWPRLPPPDGGPSVRVPGRIVAQGCRPHVRASVRVTGGAATGDALPGEMILDGLLLEGDAAVLEGDLGRFRVAHCTLASPGGVAAMTSQAGRNARLALEIERSFVGPVSVDAPARLTALDSVLGSLAAPDASAALAAVTVLGASQVQRVEASDCIFEDVLTVERRQTGCVRYSWLPPEPEAPRRYRCQPEEGRDDIVPRFASRDASHWRYARLLDDVAAEILEGSERGDEMGAFGFLRDARRLADLKRELADHLPLGLDAGILFQT